MYRKNLQDSLSNDGRNRSNRSTDEEGTGQDETPSSARIPADEGESGTRSNQATPRVDGSALLEDGVPTPRSLQTPTSNVMDRVFSPIRAYNTTSVSQDVTRAPSPSDSEITGIVIDTGRIATPSEIIRAVSRAQTPETAAATNASSRVTSATFETGRIPSPTGSRMSTAVGRAGSRQASSYSRLSDATRQPSASRMSESGEATAGSGLSSILQSRGPTPPLIQEQPDKEEVAENEFAEALGLAAGYIDTNESDSHLTPTNDPSKRMSRLDKFRSVAMSIAGQTVAESANSSPRNETHVDIGDNEMEAATFDHDKDTALLDPETNDSAEGDLVLSKPSSAEEQHPTEANLFRRKLAKAVDHLDEINALEGQTRITSAKSRQILDEVLKKPFSAFESITPKSGNGSIYNIDGSLPSSRDQSKPTSGSGRTMGSAETLRLSEQIKFSSNMIKAGEVFAGEGIGGKRRPKSIDRTRKDPFFDGADGDLKDDSLKKQRKDHFDNEIGDRVSRSEERRSPENDPYEDDSTPLLKQSPDGSTLGRVPPQLRSSLPNVGKLGSKTQLTKQETSSPRGQEGGAFQKKVQHPYLDTLAGGRGRGRGGRGRGRAKPLLPPPERSNSRRGGRGGATGQLLDPKLGVGRARSRDPSPVRGNSRIGGAPPESSARSRMGGIAESSARSRVSAIGGSARPGAGPVDEDDDDDDDDGEEESVALDEDIMLEVERQTARIMPLALKGDWPAIDHCLRILEQARIPSSKQDPYTPLKDCLDPASGYTPLLFAARDNRAQFIDRLIDLGCDPNAKTKDGWAAIHLAAMYSREEAIRALVHRRADINATGGPREQTVAHLVAGRSIGAAVALMKVILMYGKPELRLIKDNKGDLPLFTAIEAGNSGLVKELLFHHAKEQVRDARKKSKDTALHVACWMKDTELVRVLVDAGSIVDAKNAAGKTPLHVVAEVGDDVTAKFFYNIHVNPNIIDNKDRTPIHTAAEFGHTNIVELLSDKYRASVMERTKDGSTLAHIASLHGHPDTVLSFLKKGVPLHMPNKDGARCLHTAAQAGHVGVVNTILAKGEHVDVTTNLGFTALHIAVQANKPAMVETLLGWGASLKVQGGPAKESALHLAARVKNGEKCAEMLLKSGADPNLQKFDGQTPLMLAAYHGNSRVMKLLIEYGADPVVRSTNGETALHLACETCRVDVAKCLLEYTIRKSGRDSVISVVDTANLKGETPLHYTARIVPGSTPKAGDSKEMAALLLSNGKNMAAKTHETKETPFHYVSISGNEAVLTEMLAHVPPSKIQSMVNAPSKRGWSALLSAADHGHLGIVNMLLDNHARVDVFDTDGNAALHLAAAKGFKPVSDSLLAHKAFVNARNVSGLTALHLASVEGYNDLVRDLIVNHTAQKDSLSLTKQTPLHLAAENGQLEVCETLLQLGSDLNATTDEGKKAVHLAAMHNHSEVVKMFLKSSPELVSTADKASPGRGVRERAAQRGRPPPPPTWTWRPAGGRLSGVAGVYKRSWPTVPTILF